jgi:LuxR family transcriptional regulator, maltose regulon positive regulatory protein
MMDTVAPGEAASAAEGPRPRASAAQVVARPALFERLGAAARVTVVSAPPGSGKTVLLRSWIEEAGLAGRAAWVSVGREERDPQRFWLSVLGALARTDSGAQMVRRASVAPDLDGWTLVERLLRDLAAMEHRLWLVVDDVHELGSTEVLRQLELLVMRAPAEMRFVVATRHDVQLRLHRLRLEGALAEIRGGDLRFSLAEAGDLLEAAGVELPAEVLRVLHERTEGWAAGLRLAALTLAGHPDPERFAAEFSGTDRTVAEYLLAEVLERQSEPVRRLLLRTSVLERLNGELADLLSEDEGGERTLQDLESAGAFVVSLDAGRTWFRYHRLFAELLQLELRRTAPTEVARLHLAAAQWFAGRGFAVEAVRHAQTAKDWGLAVRLLADNWPTLYLDGRAAAVHEFVAAFPPGSAPSDAELAVVAAADQLVQGSLEEAERYQGLAERASASVSEERQGQVRLIHEIVGLLLARQLGNLAAVAEGAQRLSAVAEEADAVPSHLGEELRALALISLGTTELWAGMPEDAARHLEQGAALARRIERPYLELTGLAHQTVIALDRSYAPGVASAMQAIELAERHGWADDPAVGVACVMLGASLAWQGQLEEAEPWIERAERTLRPEVEPAAVASARYVRGVLELARGQNAEALAAFLAGERLAPRLLAHPQVLHPTRSLLVQALVRLDETERAKRFLAGLGDEDTERGEIRVAMAAIRLARDDPHGATTVLAPVLGGSAPVISQMWLAQAHVLEATARDALGDSSGAESALERALDLAEPNGALWPFVLNPTPELLERLARSRGTHASLVADIQDLLAGTVKTRTLAQAPPLVEPLSNAELRVLRYLPTNLSAPEIAREMYVSQNTVKTHVQNLYAKLGTHRRSEAVTRARDLGLLAPSGVRTKAVALGP